MIMKVFGTGAREKKKQAGRRNHCAAARTTLVMVISYFTGDKQPFYETCDLGLIKSQPKECISLMLPDNDTLTGSQMPL